MPNKNIALNKLEPAPDEWNFFDELPDDKMLELMNSIKDNGLQHPIDIRHIKIYIN